MTTLQQDSELVELTASELLPILIDHAQAGESVGIEGPPGGGKSSLVAEAARAAGLPLFVNNLELSDVTDGKGLPFRDTENPHQQVWIKDKRWLTGLPMAYFHDELPRASVAVQGSIASLLLENRLDDLTLPAGCWHVWAGNRTADRAGANRVPSIIYNRCFMYGLRYDAESQIEYMLGLPEAETDLLTVRYLRMKGDAALAFDPAQKINPTPRAWTTASRKLAGLPTTHFATLAGVIGKGFATELLAFRQMADSLPTQEEILLNPHSARVPEGFSAQFLVTDCMADAATVTTFDGLVDYAQRLPPELQAKFVKDSLKRCPAIASTRAFVQWGVKFAEVLR